MATEIHLDQSKDLLRRKKTRSFIRKITKILHHPKDSYFRINNSQKQKGLKKKKDSEASLPLEDIQLLGIKLYSMDYVIHVTMLDIRL
jgi:hypothetical protein